MRRRTLQLVRHFAQKSEAPSSSTGSHHYEDADQANKLIFHGILDSVLNSSAAPRQSQSKTPVTSTIHQLFDQNRRIQRERPRHVTPSIEERSPIASLLDQVSPNSTGLKEPREFLERRAKIRRALNPVLRHVKNLPTNKAVSEYYLNTVVPRFTMKPLDQHGKQEMTGPEPIVCPETACEILTHCMKTLRRGFHDPVGALHLFNQSKTESIDFFASTCLADCYNEAIRIRWEDYRDLYLVRQLATEISINAIPPNLETCEILGEVYREVLDMMNGMAPHETLPLATTKYNTWLAELNRYRARFLSHYAGHAELVRSL